MVIGSPGRAEPQTGPSNPLPTPTPLAWSIARTLGSAGGERRCLENSWHGLPWLDLNGLVVSPNLKNLFSNDSQIHRQLQKSYGAVHHPLCSFPQGGIV